MKTLRFARPMCPYGSHSYFDSMDTWISLGTTGLIVGAIAYALIFFPLILRHFRTYGTGNVPRLVGTLLTSLYGAGLVSYTLLPLPPRSEIWCYENGVFTAQLRPFQFVEDIMRETAGLSLLQTVTSFVVWQVVMNVVLFIPWGILAREFAGLKPVMAVLSGAAGSLLVEATQYTGLWGIYPCAYRTADVDDVIVNTLGALIGVLLAPVILGWMPSSHALSTRRLQPREVSVWRRLFGMSIDLAAFITITTVMSLGAQFAREGLVYFNVVDSTATAVQASWVGQVGALIAWILVFGIPASLGCSGSLGQLVVWLMPVWNNGGYLSRGSLIQRLWRAAVIPLVVVFLPLGGAVSVVVFLAAVMSVFFTRGHRGLSCVLAGAQMVDSRAVPSRAK